MLCRTTLPMTLAATLALATVPAISAMTPQVTAADRNAFRTARITLDQAVKTVQGETGGIVTSAAFYATPGIIGPKPPYGPAAVGGHLEGYEVTFIAAGTMNETYVDPRTGGRAIDAELMKHGSAFDYKIEVVRNGTLSTVLVNPASGQIASGN